MSLLKNTRSVLVHETRHSQNAKMHAISTWRCPVNRHGHLSTGDVVLLTLTYLVNMINSYVNMTCIFSTWEHPVDTHIPCQHDKLTWHASFQRDNMMLTGECDLYIGHTSCIQEQALVHRASSCQHALVCQHDIGCQQELTCKHDLVACSQEHIMSIWCWQDNVPCRQVPISVYRNRYLSTRLALVNTQSYVNMTLAVNRICHGLSTGWLLTRLGLVSTHRILSTWNRLYTVRSWPVDMRSALVDTHVCRPSS